MDKAELLKALTDDRQLTLDLLDSLDDDLLTDRVVYPDDGWTVKDILSHLIAWEAETVTALFKLSASQKPRIYGLSADDIAQRNTAWASEVKARELDAVLADFHGVRKQLIRQVNQLKPADLNASGRYNWLSQAHRNLAGFVHAYTVAHEAEHRAEIAAWLEQQA